MKNVVCILAFTFGCLVSRDARSATKPIALALEQSTVLRVGELAVLHMPSNTDRHHLNSGPGGDWRDVLALVKRSGQDTTFRAVRQGKGVVIVSPNVPAGECTSCVTSHYFIEVVSQ